MTGTATATDDPSTIVPFISRLTAIAGGVFWTLGCAQGIAVEKVGVDTYRIDCSELPLDRCLGETASNICDKRAYFVTRGISEVNPRGRSDAPDIVTSSQAIVRCAPSHGWGEQAKELMTPAATASAAPSPLPH